jgi:chromosome segregation ATPase
MDHISSLAMAGLGGALAIGLPLWLVLRGKAKRLLEELAAKTMEGELLRRQLSDRESRLQEVRSDLEKARAETDLLRDKLLGEAGQRAAFEEKSGRLPELERTLLRLGQENTALRERVSELGARMEEERSAARRSWRF